MPDSIRHDHLALLVADAERALDGMRHSLQPSLQDMPQAALHGLDLATALSRLGLGVHADVVQAVAQQLSLGQPTALGAALDIANELVVVLEETVNTPPGSHPHEPSAPWSEWRRQLNALSLGTAPQHAWHDLTSTSALHPIAGYSALSSDAPSPHPVRQPGVDLLQHARMLNGREDEVARRALDAVLAELQDRTCRLDQVPLRNLYNQAHHQVDDAWADQEIVRGLQQLQPMALRSRRIQVESRGLLVFIDWFDLVLSAEELRVTGKTLNQLAGSLSQTPDGYRLRLPCSLRRMTCMAFMMGGRRYAVSAAQCPTAPIAQAPTQADISLNLLLGEHSLTLKTDAWLGCHAMNLHPIPKGVTKPEGVSAVALDGQGRVHLWFDRAG